MKNNKQAHSDSRLIFTVEPDDISENKKSDYRNRKKLSVPIILGIIWFGLYLGSINFPVRYFFLGTGRSGLNRASYHFDFIRETLEHSYNLLFQAGMTGNIEMEYCRFLAIALAGAALATCGCVFQGTFRNVLAGPSTMGVMSGGSMGCMIYLMLFGGVGVTAAGHVTGVFQFVQRFQQQLFVLAGCLGGVLLILLVTLIAGRGKVSSSTMVIAGMVFSGVISNILLVYQYWIIACDPSDGRIEELRMLMMGHFDEVLYMPAVLMLGIPIMVCLVLLVINAGKLNLLSFGIEEAEAMGLNARRYRNLMILAGTILTAMVVSFCGRIGFVGFMVPLITRRLVGPDLKKLLPVSIVTGAIILTVIYNIASLFGWQSNISVITGPVGCAVMMVALFRKGGSRNADRTSFGASGMGIR